MSYNKVVIATQNNWFGVNPVAVTDEWWHEGPGGAVSQHQTEISGFGDDRFTVNYLYDRWGNQSWIGHPLWGSTLGCQPDVAQYRHFDGSWLNAVEANYVGNDGETIASFEYDLNGRVENTKFGPTGGIRPTLTEAQDDSGMARPKSFTLYDDQSGEVWGTGEYAYDGSGNISEIGDKRYSYDGLNRLTAYSLNEGTTVTESYDYDDFGNMESLTKSVGTNLAMVYNSSNLITSINGATLTPDTRGNITGMPFVANLLREKTFVFSNEDRMMESVDYGALPDSSDDVTWRYAYNSAGERVARWLPSATPNAPTEVRLNLRDEGGQVLNDWLWLADGNSPTLATQRDYIYGPNGMVAQMDWERGKTLFAATDHLGHTRVLFDENFDIPDDDLDLIDFAPYGEQITGAESPGTTHLFTGHERDWEDTASELDYMHARYYSPFLARFVSVDPVGGKVGSSQSWNRYSYVINNPLIAVDPNGEDLHVVLDWGSLPISNETKIEIYGHVQKMYAETGVPVSFYDKGSAAIPSASDLGHHDRILSFPVDMAGSIRPSEGSTSDASSIRVYKSDLSHSNFAVFFANMLGHEMGHQSGGLAMYDWHQGTLADSWAKRKALGPVAEGDPGGVMHGNVSMDDPLRSFKWTDSAYLAAQFSNPGSPSIAEQVNSEVVRVNGKFEFIGR